MLAIRSVSTFIIVVILYILNNTILVTCLCEFKYDNMFIAVRDEHFTTSMMR